MVNIPKTKKAFCKGARGLARDAKNAAAWLRRHAARMDKACW